MQTERSPAVLLLNLAPASLAGIDLISFTTTPRFRGIKDLPAGFHFLFTSTSNALSVRHGIWFEVSSNAGDQRPIFIAKWDNASEALLPEIDEAEKLRWRANIGEFWREGLTPYRQSATDGDADNDWMALTCYISAIVLSRITQREVPNWSLTSASSAKSDLEDIPGINAHDFSMQGNEELGLLPVDLKRTWREGALGRERTDGATDRSWALQSLVKTYANGVFDQVIGELQFCFLMTLTLNNWSCFEQWKRLLTLVFTCKAAIPDNADFFVRVIAALRLQLQHQKDADGGLIDMSDAGESLLKDLLTRFRRSLEDLPSLETQDVLDELDDLEAYLQAEYGWEFGGSFAKSGVLELEDGEQVTMDTTVYDEDDETGEYAPQVVDLSPEQARMLHIDAPDLVNRIEKTSIADDEAEHSRDSSDENDLYETNEDLEDMDQRY